MNLNQGDYVDVRAGKFGAYIWRSSDRGLSHFTSILIALPTKALTSSPTSAPTQATAASTVVPTGYEFYNVGTWCYNDGEALFRHEVGCRVELCAVACRANAQCNFFSFVSNH